MPKDVPNKSSSHPWLKGFWELGIMVAGVALPLLHQFKGEWNDQLDHQTLLIEERLRSLALCGFTLFLGLSSLWVGVLFVAVDNAGVPRGIACLGGGLFVLFLFLLIVQLTKQKGRSA